MPPCQNCSKVIFRIPHPKGCQEIKRDTFHFSSTRLLQCQSCSQFIFQKEIIVGHRDFDYHNHFIDSMEEYAKNAQLAQEADEALVKDSKLRYLELGSDWKTGKNLPKNYIEKLQRAQKDNPNLAEEIKSDYLENGFNWGTNK